MIGDKNRRADNQDRNCSGLKTDRKAMNDVGRRAGFAGLGNAQNRGMSSIVFSTSEDGPENTRGQTEVANKEERGDQEATSGNKRCVMQGLGRVHRLEDLHRTDADEGEDQTDHRQTKRQQHCR